MQASCTAHRSKSRKRYGSWAQGQGGTHPAVVTSPVDDAKHAHIMHGKIGNGDVDAFLQHDAVLVDAPNLRTAAQMNHLRSTQ